MTPDITSVTVEKALAELEQARLRLMKLSLRAVLVPSGLIALLSGISGVVHHESYSITFEPLIFWALVTSGAGHLALDCLTASLRQNILPKDIAWASRVIAAWKEGRLSPDEVSKVIAISAYAAFKAHKGKLSGPLNEEELTLEDDLNKMLSELRIRE